jgi:antirestriction protein ArdC
MALTLRGLPDPRWVTFVQAGARGWRIARGERATTISHWQWSEKVVLRDQLGRTVVGADGRPAETETALARPRVRRFSVFNARQILGADGHPLKAWSLKAPEWDPCDLAERIVRESGAKVVHHEADLAHYSPRYDHIRIPHKGAFPTAPRYYSTLLHELAHWTQHPTRFNRDAGGRGSAAYAREEILAEMVSWMLCQDLRLDYDPKERENSYRYMNFWLKGLREDPYEFPRICVEAERVRTHLVNLVPELERAQARERAQALEEMDQTEPVKPKTKRRLKNAPDGPEAPAPDGAGDRLPAPGDPAAAADPAAPAAPDVPARRYFRPAPPPIPPQIEAFIRPRLAALSGEGGGPRREPVVDFVAKTGAETGAEIGAETGAGTGAEIGAETSAGPAAGPAAAAASAPSAEPAAAPLVEPVVDPLIDPAAAPLGAGTTVGLGVSSMGTNGAGAAGGGGGGGGGGNGGGGGDGADDSSWLPGSAPKSGPGPGGLRPKPVTESEARRLRVKMANQLVAFLARPGLDGAGVERWSKLVSMCSDGLSEPWSRDLPFNDFLVETRRVAAYEAERVAAWNRSPHDPRRRELTIYNGFLMVLDAARQLGFEDFILQNRHGEPNFQVEALVPDPGANDGPARINGNPLHGFRRAAPGETPRGWAVVRAVDGEISAFHRFEDLAVEVAKAMNSATTPLIPDQDVPESRRLRMGRTRPIRPSASPDLTDAEGDELAARIVERHRRGPGNGQSGAAPAAVQPLPDREPAGPGEPRPAPPGPSMR